MFERFTDRARRVPVLAQEEARRLNNEYIGTEHFLLALIQVEGGISSEVLTHRGYTAEALRDQLNLGKTPTSGHTIPFTSNAKKVVELSLREALQLGHRYIDDFHMLFGILRLSECKAAAMLEPKTTVKVADSLRHAIMERVPGTIPIKEMHQAVMERTLIATPSEQTTDTKASLIAAINNHLMAMPEAALQNLLDSLG
jgi:ATP-dependent Clp protease ATP-binding subunit ClpA